MACQLTVFQITIFFLYLLAAVAFATSRLPAYARQAQPLLIAALVLATTGLFLHAQGLYTAIIQSNGLSLTLSNVVSLVALQLALIGLLGAVEKTLRGMSAGLILLAALIALPLSLQGDPANGTGFSWQLQAHILISIFAYGLLAVGAIVAGYSLIQNRRLRAGRLSAVNHLFAPLETTEKLLFGITAAGFAGLAVTIVSGVTFIEDMFAQHLVHKTALSLLALLVFGILLTGRMFAGWRGRNATYLYLGGFVILCLAYFGSRFVLEQVLHRSWG